MSALRAFMIYDYQRIFFFMFVRRGFQVSPKWNGCRKELENKFQEMAKKPLENFQLSSDYGMFKCKYDQKNKCYFILLSSNEVQEDYQTQVLDEIYEIIQMVPNYSKIKKEEFEQKETESIKKLLDEKDQSYIEKYGKVQAFQEPYESKIEGQMQQQANIQYIGSSNNGFQNQKAISQLQNTSALNKQSHGFNSDKDLSSDTLVKIFRCFMMWDYNRQFFYMFIRKGFPIDKTWSQERVKLENEIKAKHLDPNDPKAKPKEPPELFNYRGTFGQFKAKYDKKTKCYFILLSRFKTKEEPQLKLLDALYDEIQKVEKYITLKYDVLENKKKRALEKIIDEHEKELSSQVSQRFIDTKIMESKLGLLHQQEKNMQLENSSASLQNGGISNNNLSSKKSSIIIQNQFQQPQQQQSNIIASKLLQQKSLHQQQQQQNENTKEILQKQEQKESQDIPELHSNSNDDDKIPEITEEGQLAQRIKLYYTKPLNITKQVKSEN